MLTTRFGDVHDALAASKGPPAPESTNELPLFNIVMTHLRRLQKLRSLTIVMHKSAAEDIRNKGNPMSEMFWGRYVGSDLNLDLGGFRNLKTLRLLGIARRAGGSQTLAYQIATTLLASPNLQDFAIGLCEDYQLGRFYFFLDQLSQHYNALGGRQLPLKRLRICSRCDTYDSDGAHDGRPPFSSDMSSFCDLARLETLGLWDGWSTRNLPGRISEWNLQASVDSSMHINLIQSVRKFETIFLDDTMLSIIHTVGNDASLPPHFMSEIYISNIIYRDMMNRDAVRAKLQFSAAKSEYWPKVFCVDALEGSLAAIASTRRTILREICNWKGLQRLHIPMDLSVGEDRVSPDPMVSHFLDIEK